MALVFPGGTSITFGELGARVNQVSRGLQAVGFGAGDRLALFVHNGPAYFEATLAAGQIGVSTVPINTNFAPPEVEYILRDSQARGVLFGDSKMVAGLDAQNVSLPVHRFFVDSSVDGWDDWRELGNHLSTDAPPARCAATAMGYTSGTTGRPKGVARDVTDRDPDDMAGSLIQFLGLFGLTPEGGGRHLCCSPLYHAAPAAMALGSLQLGHTVVCMPKFDPGIVLEFIDTYAVTSTHMVPTHFHRLLRLPREQRAGANLSSLVAVVHAGAPCPPATKLAMIEWLGPVVFEYYGATEGSVSFCSPTDALEHPGTVGRPLPWVDVEILDDQGLPVAPGVEGTVYFRPPGTAFSYHNDDEKTATTRVGDLSTVGDIGKLDAEGFLFLADRRDDVIISGGVNLYPAEIEARILEHPAVADVAVVGTSDPEWGASVVAVVQLVATPEQSSPPERELREWCLGGLAKIKSPRIFEFVDSLPRTETGKLLRRQVRTEFELQHTEKV